MYNTNAPQQKLERKLSQVSNLVQSAVDNLPLSPASTLFFRSTLRLSNYEQKVVSINLDRSK